MGPFAEAWGRGLCVRRPRVRRALVTRDAAWEIIGAVLVIAANLLNLFSFPSDA